MTGTVRIAVPEDAPAIAELVQALLDEIMERTGARHFDLGQGLTEDLCRAWIADGTYTVLLAREKGADRDAGVAALCGSAALYAQGRFGIVQEFYVRPESRAKGLGTQLMEAVCAHGRKRGWKRLELCTPPLPEFDRALAFYERNGFDVTGGRKMRRLLG